MNKLQELLNKIEIKCGPVYEISSLSPAVQIGLNEAVYGKSRVINHGKNKKFKGRR